MKIKKRNLLFTAAGLAAVYIIGVFLILYYFAEHPAKVQTLIENRIKQSGTNVTIGTTFLTAALRPELTLTDFRLGDSESLYFKSKKIKIRLSFWRILFGSFQPSHIFLQHPEIVIGPKAAEAGIFKTKETSGGGFYLPVIEIRQGLLRAYYKGKLVAFDHINITADKDRMKISDMLISTPDVTARLWGEVLHPGNIRRTVLDLNVQSDAFVYEKVVDYLPAAHFQEWLNRLLFKQIKGGRAEIVEMSYKGTAAALTNVKTFFNNLYIKAKLEGVSYGAGPGPERIIDVSGTAVFAKDDLSFYGLSGYIGNSLIHKVDLIFPKLSKPGTNVSVDADLNMNLKDFVDTWRAAIPLEKVQDLLNPVAIVENGVITGKARYSYNGLKKISSADGDVIFQDCTFNWGKSDLKHISGKVSSKEMAVPLDVDVSGIFNNMPISRLLLTFDDPFVKKTYRFSMIANGLPDIRAFQFDDDTEITYSGIGKGLSITGDVKVVSKGFALFGTDYVPVSGDFTGNGELKGELGPETVLDLNNIRIGKAPNGLSADVRIKGSGGSLFLKGGVNMQTKAVFDDDVRHPFKGNVDMSLAWRDAGLVYGHIDCKEMFIARGNKSLVLDGIADIEDGELTTSHLKIKGGTSTADITGRIIFGDPARFDGDIAIDDMVLGNGNGGGLDVDKDTAFEIKADLRLNNLDLFGTKVRKATSRVIYKDNILKLKKIKIKDIAGEGSGKATIKLPGNGGYDATVSMTDVGVNKLFEAVSKEKPWIDGTMNVEGSLRGRAGKGVSGKLTLKAKDGNFKKYSVLSKFFGALNLYKLVKSGGSVLKGKEFPYNSIKATFDIKEDVARFNNFYMDSNSLQLSAVGEYNIRTKHIDAVIGVQPLETIDRIVNILPVVGWVLTGDKGQFIVVTFKMTGHINDPKIEAAPVDSVMGPVVESIKRVFKLPLKIVTDPRQLLPGTKEK